MSFNLLCVLLIFFSHGGLLAITMYTLICLSDLEQDFINPHDSSKRINRFVLPEIGLVALQAVLALFTRHWLLFLANIGLSYFHYTLWQRKQHMVEVTEIFKQLPREKNIRLYKLAYYVIFFVLVIYWLVLAFLDDVFPDSESRESMKKVLAQDGHDFSLIY